MNQFDVNDVIPYEPILYANVDFSIPYQPQTVFFEKKATLLEIVLYDPILKYDTCSICLENFEQIEIYKLRCGHLFHKNCLNEWMSHKTTCPLDRKKI